MTRVTTRRARASVAMKETAPGAPGAPPLSLLTQWRTASSVRMRKKRSVRSSNCARTHGPSSSASLKLYYAILDYEEAPLFVELPCYSVPLCYQAAWASSQQRVSIFGDPDMFESGACPKKMPQQVMAARGAMVSLSEYFQLQRKMHNLSCIMLHDFHES